MQRRRVSHAKKSHRFQYSATTAYSGRSISIHNRTVRSCRSAAARYGRNSERYRASRVVRSSAPRQAFGLGPVTAFFQACEASIEVHQPPHDQIEARGQGVLQSVIRDSSAAMREVVMTANTVNMIPLKTIGTPMAKHSWTLSISALSIPYTPHKSPSPAPTSAGYGSAASAGARSAASDDSSPDGRGPPPGIRTATRRPPDRWRPNPPRDGLPA